MKNTITTTIKAIIDAGKSGEWTVKDNVAYFEDLLSTIDRMSDGEIAQIYADYVDEFVEDNHLWNAMVITMALDANNAK